MNKILFLSLSSLDNDTRILKEIKSLKEHNYIVNSLSINTNTNFDFNISINHVSKRILGIPGISTLILYNKVIYKIIKKYKNIDIIHCNDLNTLPVGVIIKKFFNKIRR